MTNNKEALIISTLLLLTVLAWITFDVYHALSTSTFTPTQQEMSKLIPSQFNHEVILSLYERGK